jgi:hypothetical protein
MARIARRILPDETHCRWPAWIAPGCAVETVETPQAATRPVRKSSRHLRNSRYLARGMNKLSPQAAGSLGGLGRSRLARALLYARRMKPLRPFVLVASVAILVAFSAPGCGDSAISGGGVRLDANAGGAADVGVVDADRLACGNTFCDPSQICLYPAYGCIAMPVPDSGACPDGWEWSTTSSACVQSRPTPSCVTPTPGQGSFDCSEGGRYPSCATVNTPIPSTCSRTCRAICA